MERPTIPDLDRKDSEFYHVLERWMDPRYKERSFVFPQQFESRIHWEQWRQQQRRIQLNIFEQREPGSHPQHTWTEVSRQTLDIAGRPAGYPLSFKPSSWSREASFHQPKGVVKPSPAIKWNDGKVTVNTKPKPSPQDLPVNRVSVNSFGYGRTNAHMIIEGPDSPVPNASKNYKYRHSARSAKMPRSAFYRTRMTIATLKANIDVYGKVADRYTLLDLSYTLANRRSRLTSRGFAVASHATLESAFHKQEGFHLADKKKAPTVGFAFTGQGAHTGKLDAGKVFARSVKTGGKTYHSYHMAPVPVEYEAAIRKAKEAQPFDLPALPKARMVSSVTNSSIPDDAVIDETYWSANLRTPVLLNQAIQTITKHSAFSEVDLLIEVGPHSALSTSEFSLEKFQYLPTLSRGADSAAKLLELAGELFLRDYPVDMENITTVEEALPGGKIHNLKGSFIVDLPSYQLNRKDRKHRAPTFMRHDILGSLFHGGSFAEPTWRNVLRQRDAPWLKDHSLGGEADFPAAGYFSKACEAISQLNELSPNPVAMQRYVSAMCPSRTPWLLLMATTESKYTEWWEFNASSVSKKGARKGHMAGTISINSRKRGVAPKKAPELPQRPSGESWSQALRDVGFDYGTTFQDIQDIRFDGKTYAATCKTAVKNPNSTLPAIQKAFETVGWHTRTSKLANCRKNVADLVVMLADLEGPILSTLHDDALAAIQAISTTASFLLWVTTGGLLTGKKPEHAMAAGLARVMTSQQASLDLTTLDFDLDNTDAALVPTMIARAAKEQNDKSFADENETYIANNLAHISRLVPNVEVNESFSKEEQTASSAPFDPERTTRSKSKSSMMVSNKEDIAAINGTDYVTNFLSEVGGVVRAIRPVRHIPESSCQLLAKIESNESLGEVVGVLMAYGTTLYGMHTLARVEAGDTVLVLQGTGLPGLAAIRIAQIADATPYVVVDSEVEAARTVGSPMKSESKNIAELDDAVAFFAGSFSAGKALIEYKKPDWCLNILLHKPQLRFKDNATYLLVGCLGGLGRSLSSWMMKRGARRFAFLSRSGVDAPSAAALVKDVQAAGTEVSVIRGDVTKASDVERAVQSIPSKHAIAGAVHAAMVLRDGLFDAMTYENWKISITIKVQGVMNLHKALQNTPLDFFVMTSSVSGRLGAAGQSNYAAANSFLDAIAKHRQAQCQRAVSVILPMVLGVGVVAENNEIEEALKRKRMYGIDEEHLLEAFEAAMSIQDTADHLVVGLDPAKLQRSMAAVGATDNFWTEDVRFNNLLAIMRSSTAGRARARASSRASRPPRPPVKGLRSRVDTEARSIGDHMMIDLGRCVCSIYTMHFIRLTTSWLGILSTLLGTSQVASAIQLDLGSTQSIKNAASTVAHGMMTYYKGNETGMAVGLLPDPYYWWLAGAMFDQMIHYWYYTGDSTYNKVVTQGLMAQISEDKDFMPRNQTRTEGNDDQAFWAFAAMSAAELNFPDPPPDQPSWLALAQAVFNEQARRWDTSACGGGLRWQIFQWNKGYEYKNSISNGGFFQLAARLARYTGNKTYADWADKTWDWMETTPLITDQYNIYDGADMKNNCSQPVELQWTYNVGTFLMGAANLYNYTNGSQKWRTHTEGLLKGTQLFFPAQFGGNIMQEVACEPQGSCNNDQPSFKAYLSRWMAATTQIAPFTANTIMPKLRASAQGAAKQCSGAPNGGTTCGRTWNTATWDGKIGIGEQMSALSVIQSNLISKVAAPVTADKGGTSKGNPDAGTGPSRTVEVDPVLTRKVTMADKAGAGILTALVLGGLLGSTWWISIGS
ncbi:MAG: hypothetical protein Q9210_001842 [Variospora velana]